MSSQSGLGITITIHLLNSNPAQPGGSPVRWTARPSEAVLLSTTLYYSLLLSTTLYYALLLSATLYYSLILSATLYYYCDDDDRPGERHVLLVVRHAGSGESETASWSGWCWPQLEKILPYPC